MKALLILIFLLPAVASADKVKVCAEFERGPELDQLAATCDIIKIDWPEWENADCLNYFARVGGRDVFKRKVIREALAARNTAIKTQLAAFDANLPLPLPAPAAGIGLLPTPTPEP
jgi:hypothetical protein